MPTWGWGYESPGHYKRMSEFRRQEEKKLVAKGLIRNSNKFREVMWRKMRRFR